MTARESELEEQSHDHLERQMLPTWVLAGLGSLFVIGCALVLLFLVGLVLPGSLGDSLDWLVGLVGVGAAAIAGLTKFFMERSAEGRVDRCHQQLSLLSQQIEQAKAERDELDARLPRGGGPLAVRLQTAEKWLAELEELLPLESARESADGGAASGAGPGRSAAEPLPAGSPALAAAVGRAGAAVGSLATAVEGFCPGTPAGGGAGRHDRG